MADTSDAPDPAPDPQRGFAAPIISAQTMAALGRFAESMVKLQQSPGMAQIAESVAKMQSTQMKQIAVSMVKLQQSPAMVQIAESMVKLQQSPAMAQLARRLLAQQSVGLAQTARRAVEAQRSPAFEQLLQGVLNSHTRPEARVPQDEEATRQFLVDLGAVGHEDDNPIPFAPSPDDTAYEVLVQAAPGVAAAIDEAAQRARLPLWSRRAVRNGLAWLLATLIMAAYVGGTVLFPPWGVIFVALLSGGGVTAPEVYKRASGPAEDDSSPPSDG